MPNPLENVNSCNDAPWRIGAQYIMMSGFQWSQKPRKSRICLSPRRIILDVIKELNAVSVRSSPACESVRYYLLMRKVIKGSCHSAWAYATSPRRGSGRHGSERSDLLTCRLEISWTESPKGFKGGRKSPSANLLEPLDSVVKSWSVQLCCWLRISGCHIIIPLACYSCQLLTGQICRRRPRCRKRISEQNLVRMGVDVDRESRESIWTRNPVFSHLDFFRLHFTRNKDDMQQSLLALGTGSLERSRNPCFWYPLSAPTVTALAENVMLKTTLQLVNKKLKAEEGTGNSISILHI